MSAVTPHEALLRADWPAPGNVSAFTTLRRGAGMSQPPFERFNLGARCGDEPGAVARNRAELVRIGCLPAVPCWLRQVHGTQVYRAGARPHPPSGHLAARPCPAQRAGRSGVREPVARNRHAFTPQAGEGNELPPPSLVGDRDELLPLPLAGEGWGEGARSAEPEADAAVTAIPATVIAILTADCLPVLLCADDGSEVAAAHAGWRGLAAGVLEATVAAMRTPPQRLLAWLGPAAGPQRYEVGQEVLDAFVSRDPGAAAAFAGTRPQHWRVDLYALARHRLAAAGIDAQRVHGGGLCTIGDAERFYSHRRDQRTGRMATLIWMEPAPAIFEAYEL